MRVIRYVGIHRERVPTGQVGEKWLSSGFKNAI